MWGIKASMPRGKTHMGSYVPFVDFIMHIFSCDVFLLLPHVQRLCYGIAIPPTSIIHSRWLKDTLEWIVHKCFLSKTATFLSGDLLLRIRGFDFNLYKYY